MICLQSCPTYSLLTTWRKSFLYLFSMIWIGGINVIFFIKYKLALLSGKNNKLT
jgi:hypothetical protein